MYFVATAEIGAGYDILADDANDDSTFFVGDTAMTVLLELDTAANVAWSTAI